MEANMIAPPPEVAGTSLDGESYEITGVANTDLCRSVGVEPAADGSAHPIFFYIATQVAMGMTVAGLCEACDFRLEDGPMLGGCDAEFADRLMVGVPYAVRGEILSLTRKQSAALGVMDLLGYRLSLVAPSGETAMSTVNTWILPRRATS